MESGPGHRLDQQLRDAIPARYAHRLLPVMVDEQDLDLTAIAGVDDPWGIDHSHPGFSGQPAAGNDQTHEPHGQRQRYCGGHTCALTRRQHHLNPGMKISPTVTRMGIIRQRQIRIEQCDQNVDIRGVVPGHRRTAYAGAMTQGAADNITGAWIEGRDGNNPTYLERLRPSVWAWLVPLGAAIAMAVAYLVALGPWGALITFVVVLGLGSYVLMRSVAVVRVDDHVFRAGRARLPLEHIGRVRALDAAASERMRSSGANASAFYLLRVGYARTAIAVEVTDPRDPHPFWVVSTRRPEELASAIMDAVATHARLRTVTE